MTRQGKLTTWDWQWINSIPAAVRCLQLNDQQIAFFLSQMMQSQWETRWANKPTDFTEIIDFTATAQKAILADYGCSGGGGAGGGAGGLLPDCVTYEHLTNTLTIELERCNDMTINIYQNCGCGNQNCGGGCGGSTGNYSGEFSGGSSGGAGASGSWVTDANTGQTYDGVFSDCDFITGGGMDYILDQCAELWATVAANAEAGLGLIQGLWAIAETFSLGTITAEGWSWLKDVTESGATNVETMFNDTDFRQTVKVAWIKIYPNARDVSGVTRDRLMGIADAIPAVSWEGTLPYPQRQLWTNTMRFLNMDKLNTALSLFEGDCDENDYGYLYEIAGVGYLSPPAAGAYTPPQPIASDWVYEWDFVAGYPSEQGWTGGREPQDPSYGVLTVDGWANAPAGGHRHVIGVKYLDLTLNVVGVEVYMNQPLGGNDGDLRTFEHPGTLYDTTYPMQGMQVLLTEIPAQSYDKLEIEVQVNLTDSNPATGYYIEKIRLYGNGTVPTTGAAV